MQKLGTTYGGWLIPREIELNENSIIYSGGVGEDISFDLLLSDKYKSHIYLLDPTKRAIKHFDEIKKYYETKNWKFSGDIQKDYKSCIETLNPDFSKIFYKELALWNKKDKLKFYLQYNKNYVSQSLIENMFGNDYYLVDCLSIKEIMEAYGHTKLDLLKLDIEGAENIVLEQMLNDKIYPKYLCIEFDLLLKRKDPEDTTKKIVYRLQQEGYQLLVNDNLNITFKYVRNDE